MIADGAAPLVAVVVEKRVEETTFLAEEVEGLVVVEVPTIKNARLAARRPIVVAALIFCNDDDGVSVRVSVLSLLF